MARAEEISRALVNLPNWHPCEYGHHRNVEDMPLLVNLSEISLATVYVGMILKIDDLVPVR